MKKRSLFLKYFLSYLVIGIIPFFFALIFYYSSISTLEREIERSHIAALDQAAKEMDYITGEMKNIAWHFSGFLEGLNGSSKTLDAINSFDHALISQYIQYYEETLNYPVLIALFFRGETWLYTSQGKLAYVDFEGDLKPDGDLTMSSFYTRINSIRTSSSLGFSQAPASQIHVNTGMAYLYPLPSLDLLPRATLCFIFRNSSIREMLENYLGDIKGNFFLFNEMLIPLFNDSNLLLPEEASMALGNIRGVGVQERKIGGSPYILVRSVSENTGLSLVQVMKYRDFYFRIQGTRLVFFITAAFLEIVVIIFAIVMSRRNYQPIRSLLSNIGISMWKNEESPGGNEFDLIQDKVNTIEDANQELSHALDRQRPIVAYSCLRSLLSGENSAFDEMDYYLKYAKIEFKGPWFFVFLIAPAATERKISEISMRSQIRMILAAAEGNYQDQCRLYGLELIPEQQVAVIVNAVKRRSGGEDMRQFMAKLLAVKTKENFNIELKICSGRIYDSPMKIQASFLEAKAVMEDYLLCPGNTVLYEDMLNQGAIGYYYPVIEQSLYLQSVKQANESAAIMAIDAMVDKAARAGAFPVTQCLCFDIINTIMKVAGELKNEVSLNEIKAITSFADLGQFRLLARSLTEDICRKSMELRTEKAGRLKSKIIAYVNENFCNVQFSLQEAADHFDLASSYLSRFFKQETGHNFVDYVSMLRLDKAREFLITTDKQLKEIVYDVGYMDSASFVRKFKAREGITPGQYREKYKKRI